MNRGIRTHVPALWGVAISGWVIHLRAGGLRKDTLSTHQQRLERTARHIGAPRLRLPPDLRPEVVEQDVYAWGVLRDYIAASPALVLPKVKAGLASGSARWLELAAEHGLRRGEAARSRCPPLRGRTVPQPSRSGT